MMYLNMTTSKVSPKRSKLRFCTKLIRLLQLSVDVYIVRRPMIRSVPDADTDHGSLQH